MLDGMGTAMRVVLAMGLLTAACSGGGGGAPQDAAMEVPPPPPMSCQAIRLCAFECGDSACVQNCASHGSTAAQAAFEPLRACTVAACMQGDVTCACVEQCLADGACLTEVDTCLAGTSGDDLICTDLCH
jgi:hypothetical protein